MNDLTNDRKTVAKDVEESIKNNPNIDEHIKLHEVGMLNRDIYKCITEDIVTDEVIITEKQMQHIYERHPDVYEKVIEYLLDIIDEPDFIIEDKHPNTGLVIKKN